MKNKKWNIKQVDKPSPKKRKYLTKRIKRQRAYWGLIVGLTILAATLMYYYPQYVYDEISTFKAVEVQNVISIAPSDLKTPTSQIDANKSIPQASVPSIEQQIRDIAKIECDKRNLGDYCVKDLVAIAWTESRFDSKARGDSGKSIGAYQIHLGYHKHITVEQAEDLNFATAWTLNRMIYYGYPTYRSYSIMKHNGTPNTTKTLAYLKAVNNYN